MQLALVGSEGAQHCMKKDKGLESDAQWMRSLAIAQLVTIPVFMLWRHFSIIKDPSDHPSPAHYAEIRKKAEELEQARQNAIETHRKYKNKSESLD